MNKFFIFYNTSETAQLQILYSEFKLKKAKNKRFYDSFQSLVIYSQLIIGFFYTFFQNAMFPLRGDNEIVF